MKFFCQKCMCNHDTKSKIGQKHILIGSSVNGEEEDEL